MAIDQAFVLAAGFGTRLRPLTDDKPKPLVQLRQRPIVDYILEKIEKYNVKTLVMNGHYKGEQIAQYLESYPTGMTCAYSHEEIVLETGGGIVHGLKHLDFAPFFVVNGDAFWVAHFQPIFKSLDRAWKNNKMDALLMLCPTEKAVGYAGKGDFFLEDDGRLRRREQDEESAPYVYMGVHVTHPRLFGDAPEGAFSLNVVWDKALAEDRLYGKVFDGKWFHISTPEDLQKTEDFLKI
ncbi:MAG: nucleotidyltransferase family protein [Alphaproteobacteria bacterium]